MPFALIVGGAVVVTALCAERVITLRLPCAIARAVMALFGGS